MKITNQFNLPPAMVTAVSKQYDVAENEYRVTSLLKGVREIILLRRHDAEIEVDVSEMIWAIFGTAVHNVFGRQEESPNYFKESRLYHPFGNYILSGQFDEYHIDGMELNDFKVTSVYKILLGDFDDWYKQQHIYAYLLAQHSIPTSRGKVTALLRDWMPYKARYEKDYPPLPVYVKEFSIKQQDQIDIEGFIFSKFEEIDYWLKKNDDDLPICTPEERWYNGETFAVMKNENIRAARVLDTEEDAAKWIKQTERKDKKPAKYQIVLRPGENKKCIYYCNANKFCSFYNEQVVERAELAAVPF